MRKNKYYTIIIIPDAQANYHKICVSKRKLNLILSCLISFVVLFIASIGTSIITFKKNSSLEKLVPDNKRLQQENSIYKKAIIDLDKRLEDFTLLAKKLKLMAGITQPADVSIEAAGIGGVSESEANLLSKNSLRDINKLYKSSENLNNTFNFLEQSFQKQYLLLAATPSISPVKGFISSGFGFRRNPFTSISDFHMGIDITAPLGKPVLSAANGIVSFAGFKSGYGNLITIDHGYGIQTNYAHLSKILVKVGQKVKRWDIIGLVGDTGQSTAPHLHYEIVKNNNPVNPLDYMLDFEYLQ